MKAKKGRGDGKSKHKKKGLNLKFKHDDGNKSDKRNGKNKNRNKSTNSDESERTISLLPKAQSSAPIQAKVIPSSETRTFADIGVQPWIVAQCSQMGIGRPSPVQANCIPQVLSGRDVLGCAKTGTGKTLAFAIPILQTLAADPYGIFALILTPTRELAFQIGEQFLVLGKPLGIKCSVVTGGRDMVIQGGELERRPHVVIATPGRLKDHIETRGEQSTFPLLFAKLKFLVLDEADRLLAGQYTDQLKTIFGYKPLLNNFPCIVPKERQTLLFSATITDALTELHQVSVTKPYFYEDHESDVALGTVDNLEQRYVMCPADVKDAYLVYVVKNFIEKNPESSVLVFCHTCRECEAIAGMFSQLRFKVGSLHSQIRQRDRMGALTKFRDNRIPILVCTDVASRGLDIPTVDLVICHNVPSVSKTYVHRIGRSARAGRFGSAITFVTQYDLVLLQAIESQIGSKLIELKVNDKNVTRYVSEVLVAKREAEIKLDRENFGEKREVNRRKQMILEGLDPDEVDVAIERQRQQRTNDNQRRIGALQRKTDRLDKDLKQKKKSKRDESVASKKRRSLNASKTSTDES